MKYNLKTLGKLTVIASISLLGLSGCDVNVKEDNSYTDVSSADCPGGVGWSEGLAGYFATDAVMPTTFSASAVDCDFNKWSWEAFVWATADINGAPRFMGMKTSGDLFPEVYAKSDKGILRLAARSSSSHNSGTIEGAGAFVQADGSMLVGQNGYPVYASIHMNDSYFNTAKNNLIVNNGTTKNSYDNPLASDDYFSVGDAVIKASWYRLEDGKAAPTGTYTTKAEVPILEKSCEPTRCFAIGTGRFETVTVALIGLHVVGYVEHHPEFIWATFEHNLNAPMIDDNTFTYDASKSDPKDYTLYKANTPYSKDKILVATQPETFQDSAVLRFDALSGKFSPVTNVVQMNKTGGDDQPNGPQNIAALNSVSQQFLSTPDGKNSIFQNYNLIGSVWMEPDTFVETDGKTAWKTMGASDAVGGVKLANSTAETFMQNDEIQQGGNCFECHNATSFAYPNSGANVMTNTGGKALKARRIAISHMVAEGSNYAVPNVMPILPIIMEDEDK